MKIAWWNQNTQNRSRVHAQTDRRYTVRHRGRWLQIPRYAATPIPESLMSKLRLKWSIWLYGSIGAMIGGGSSAVVATVSAMTITPMDYDLNRRLENTIQLFGTCFVLNAIISLFLWLKQRPLPDIEPDEPDEP